MKFLIQFFLSLFFVLVLDTIWLGFVMKHFYRIELGTLARTIDGQFNPILWAAAVVYVTLAFGITFFILPRSTDLIPSFLSGAALGFVIYAVYDFTNLSTLQNWSLKMTLVDVAWGTLLCGTVSALVTLVNNKFAS